jgi:hypothetical protein
MATPSLYSRQFGIYTIQAENRKPSPPKRLDTRFRCRHDDTSDQKF